MSERKSLSITMFLCIRYSLFAVYVIMSNRAQAGTGQFFRCSQYSALTGFVINLHCRISVIVEVLLVCGRRKATLNIGFSYKIEKSGKWVGYQLHAQIAPRALNSNVRQELGSNRHFLLINWKLTTYNKSLPENYYTKIYNSFH